MVRVAVVLAWQCHGGPNPDYRTHPILLNNGSYHVRGADWCRDSVSTLSVAEGLAVAAAALCTDVGYVWCRCQASRWRWARTAGWTPSTSSAHEHCRWAADKRQDRSQRRKPTTGTHAAVLIHETPSLPPSCYPRLAA